MKPLIAFLLLSYTHIALSLYAIGAHWNTFKYVLLANPSGKINREYKSPKPHKTVPNEKAHLPEFLHGNQRFTAPTGSGTCFLFFPLSIPSYMTKPCSHTGIYRCSVFGIWVKGHNAGYRWERPFWEIESAAVA